MFSFYMAQFNNMASAFPQKNITENLTEKTAPNESNQFPPNPAPPPQDPPKNHNIINGYLN